MAPSGVATRTATRVMPPKMRGRFSAMDCSKAVSVRMGPSRKSTSNAMFARPSESSALATSLMLSSTSSSDRNATSVRMSRTTPRARSFSMRQYGVLSRLSTHSPRSTTKVSCRGAGRRAWIRVERRDAAPRARSRGPWLTTDPASVAPPQRGKLPLGRFADFLGGGFPLHTQFGRISEKRRHGAWLALSGARP